MSKVNDLPAAEYSQHTVFSPPAAGGARLPSGEAVICFARARYTQSIPGVNVSASAFSSLKTALVSRNAPVPAITPEECNLTMDSYYRRPAPAIA